MVKITTEFGQGGTIQTLADILQQRMKYMGETARDSSAAVAINMLKSIRTITKVAKPEKVKVQVKRDTSFYPSAYWEGGKKKLCIRITGSKQHYRGSEKQAWCNEKAPLKTQGIYRFTDEHKGTKTEYLIVAPSVSAAKQKAKMIVQGRVKKFAGLAKRALAWLMFKTNSRTVIDKNTNLNVESKANSLTRKTETIQKNADESGTYTLTLTDELKYALLAIKGGRSALDGQMKKAANKIVSVMNQKLKSSDFFSNQKLPTPFPEVKQRR